MANSIFLGPNVPQTINGTLTVNGSVTLPGASDFIAFGAAPASAGELRFSNADEVYARNAANSANLRMFQLGISDSIVMGNTTGVVSSQMQALTSIQFFQGATNSISFSSSNFRPAPDATLDLGSAVNRWNAAYVSAAVLIGTNPAAAGTIRLASLATISARNAANSADVNVFSVDSGNETFYGSASSVAAANVRSGIAVRLVAGSNFMQVAPTNVLPSPDATLSFGSSSNRWTAGFFSTAIVLGTNPSTAGTVRVQHNASCSGRNSANSGDLRVWDFGVVANNESRFGDPAVNNRICSLLTTPATLSNGDWWVECSGVSPARTASILVRDGGATRTIATSVAY